MGQKEKITKMDGNKTGGIKMKEDIKRAILLIIVVISFAIIYVATHEHTHAIVAEYFGCTILAQGTNVLKMKAFTVVSCPIEVSDDLIPYDLMNEIIGYNVSLPLYFIAAFLCFIILDSFMEDKKKK